MGKSGIIARKLAATLSSTGTAALFLHPAEALHGDLGVVQSGDVVVALSHSGETDELVRLLEAIRRIGARLIALTGQPASTLGQAADVDARLPRGRGSLPDESGADGQHDRRARARRRAGDGACRIARASSEEHFANLHPGGQLGKRLMRVESLMTAGDGRAAGAAGHADARRHSRDVQQATGHDVSSSTATAGWRAS